MPWLLPTVQVSAGLMTLVVHRLFRVPLSSAVVIAGGAAGVSAAFNTPLAGVTFALEELAAAYEQRLTLLVMAAVVVSGLVTLGIAGGRPGQVRNGPRVAPSARRNFTVRSKARAAAGGSYSGRSASANQCRVPG